MSHGEEPRWESRCLELRTYFLSVGCRDYAQRHRLPPEAERDAQSCAKNLCWMGNKLSEVLRGSRCYRKGNLHTAVSFRWNDLFRQWIVQITRRPNPVHTWNYASYHPKPGVNESLRKTKCD
ncbi:hypothetical protein HYALB_00001539 [Hymenoscyphus albidus]|uniref:Uncharacterized protein n=1 Tax=Hymenoscyphus albidus TaxID=595503 RepID=A0A9N9Q0K8_9HELO|nr:hypothetical protein HYALB_00001539 [Hymenoscyphus albidus]